MVCDRRKEAGGGRREAGATRDTESKTRTPHKVVGNKSSWTKSQITTAMFSQALQAKKGGNFVFAVSKNFPLGPSVSLVRRRTSVVGCCCQKKQKPTRSLTSRGRREPSVQSALCAETVVLDVHAIISREATLQLEAGWKICQKKWTGHQIQFGGHHSGRLIVRDQNMPVETRNL